VSLELIIFFIISLITIFCAVSVIKAEEIFHSALYLAMMFFGIASLFIMLNAEFLAAIQVLVYAGAVTILMLFAIMFTKRDEAEVEKDSIPKLTLISIFLFNFIFFISQASWWNYVPDKIITGSVKLIGLVMFNREEGYFIPFEIISVVILAAMIGAIFIAVKKRANEGVKKGVKEEVKR